MYKRRRRIDYHNKNLINPFFQRRKRKKVYLSAKTWPGRKKLIIFGILILIVGLVWLICFSTIFTIEKIAVRGAARISAEEIENLVWQQTRTKRFLFFPQTNLLVFAKKRIVKELKENYSFEKLIINKNLPHTLTLDIQEKSYAFIWCEADKYYYADADGYLINEINPLEIKQKKYPIIQNQAEEKIINNEGEGGIGKIDIDSNYINYVISLFNKLSSNPEGEGDNVPGYQGLTIEKFIIDKEVNTVKMALVDGPTVYFNTNEDQEKQIKKLLIIKEEKLKDDFKNKNYIDLRYGDRVYYR